MKRLLTLSFTLCMFNFVYSQSNSFKSVDYGKKLLECYYTFKIYVYSDLELECNSIIREKLTNLVTFLSLQLNDNKTVLKTKLGVEDQKELEEFISGCKKQPIELTSEQIASAQIWLRLWDNHVLRIFSKLSIP